MPRGAGERYESPNQLFQFLASCGESKESLRQMKRIKFGGKNGSRIRLASRSSSEIGECECLICNDEIIFIGLDFEIQTIRKCRAALRRISRACELADESELAKCISYANAVADLVSPYIAWERRPDKRGTKDVPICKEAIFNFVFFIDDLVHRFRTGDDLLAIAKEIHQSATVHEENFVTLANSSEALLSASIDWSDEPSIALTRDKEALRESPAIACMCEACANEFEDKSATVADYLSVLEESEMNQLDKTKPDAAADIRPIDFLIVTPLGEERDAVLELLDNPKQLPPDNVDNRVYFKSRLAAKSDDQREGHYQIVVVPLVGMGTGQAAVTTSDAIRRWSPRYVIVVGIAGGVRKAGVGLGDVLVANQIADYTLQKHRSGKPAEIRWQVQPVDTGLLERANNFLNKDWISAVNCERPLDGQPRHHIGPIASGDHVVASDQLLAAYSEPWPKLIGVEMEAAGIVRVAFQSVQQAGFFMVRGVSDLADPEKDSPEVENWRTYACKIAATYAISFLRSGPVTFAEETKISLVGSQEAPLSFSKNKVSEVTNSTLAFRNNNKLDSGAASSPDDEDATTTSYAFDESTGIEQLIEIATEHLKNCEEAKKTIIKFNDDLKEPMSAERLARTMLKSGLPMSYLFNCTHRRYAFTAARESHYKKCMLSLANVFAPLCLGTKNLKSVAEMVKNAAEPLTEISTKESLIAKAVVGLIHGVPIDGHDSFEEIRSGRDFASSFTIPEKLDEEWDDIVQLFTLGLAKFLRAHREVLAAVRAALRVQQQKGVHLCVLFAVSHNVEALKKLKNAIPELILLVSSAEDESDTNDEVLMQFRDVNAFFGA